FEAEHVAIKLYRAFQVVHAVARMQQFCDFAHACSIVRTGAAAQIRKSSLVWSWKRRRLVGRWNCPLQRSDAGGTSASALKLRPDRPALPGRKRIAAVLRHTDSPDYHSFSFPDPHFCGMMDLNYGQTPRRARTRRAIFVSVRFELAGKFGSGAQ